MNASVGAPDPNRLSSLAPEVASTIVRVAGDIALVIGPDGVVRNVAAGPLPLHTDGAQWIGRPWADTVEAGTRQALELLLQEAQRHGVSRRRELNHPGPEGQDIPMSWAAVRLGEHGPVLAVGRDMRSVSAIHQQFLDNQQSLERDYWQRRQTENHTRLLYQVAQDAALVLDAEHFTVREANAAALALFEQPGAPLLGQPLRPCVEAALQPALEELLLTASATGRPAELRLRVAGRCTAVDLSATPFSAEGERCLLLRARRADAPTDDASALFDFVDKTPESVLVTDTSGRVLWANRAFVTLCDAPDELRLKGRGLAELLGDPHQQWQALLARVRSRGVVAQTTVALRVPGMPALSAEVSAALLADGEQEHIGFTLRPGVQLPPPDVGSDTLAQDMTQLLSRVGRDALPELLLHATRLAELHLIRAALDAAQGQIEAASLALQIPVPALQQRMRQLGLGTRAAGRDSAHNAASA